MKIKKDTSMQSIRKLSEGFYKLSRQEREERLIEMGVLSSEDLSILHRESGLDFNLADQFIENAIGCFPLPLGVALNFIIDGQHYAIPMAVEETSIIAGLSGTAKWISERGDIKTQSIGRLGLGQIQLPKVKDIHYVKKQIEIYKKELISKTNEKIAMRLVERGGGVQDLIVREIPRPDDGTMVVIHVLVDTCDAMGANTINQICEFLKNPIEEILNEFVGVCILSNLTDDKIVQADVVIRNIDEQLGHAIAEASLFAQLDSYRAATNNKGVLNGIDAVLIATGNDWRAVEAGIHAYAAHKGQYTSITKWWMKDQNLYGTIKAPIAVGIVGGVTRLHPMAQLCLKMLDVKSASELARVVAAVGLVQNLAALRALVTDGINQGHMKLHLANLILASGANKEEAIILRERLLEQFEKQKKITESDAKDLLIELRKK